MKKIFCFILLLSLCLMFNLSTYALDIGSNFKDINLNSIYTGHLVQELDSNEFALQNKELENKGRQIIKLFKKSPQFSKTTAYPNFLNVPHYFQNGESWSNDIMKPAGLTIGYAGCALTSFTMVENYLNKDNLNPGHVNSLLGNSACDLQWRNASYIFNLNLQYYKTEPDGLSQNDVNNFIVGAITYGFPVIIGTYNKKMVLILLPHMNLE